MSSLQLALNSQDGDYVKNHLLSFNICQEVLNHQVPRKKNSYAGIIDLSWLRRYLNYLKLSYKGNVSETNFANLNEKDMINNRKFWHIIKFFISDKIESLENIILVNNEKIISDEMEVANTLNKAKKEVVLVPEICRAKNFLYLTRPHNQIYISEYILQWKKKRTNKKQNILKNKREKQKKTKKKKGKKMLLL